MAPSATCLSIRLRMIVCSFFFELLELATWRDPFPPSITEDDWLGEKGLCVKDSASSFAKKQILELSHLSRVWSTHFCIYGEERQSELPGRACKTPLLFITRLPFAIVKVQSLRSSKLA